MNHRYAAHIVWDGNLGDGTSSSASYGRRYHVQVDGKPDLQGTADPAFRGEPDRHNPEDLFLAAVSACHLLTYLALCAQHGVRVVAYRDAATGTLTTDSRGGGRFVEVILQPQVTVADPAHAARAEALHDSAHELCFIANSVSVPIRLRATVQVETGA